MKNVLNERKDLIPIMKYTMYQNFCENLILQNDQLKIRQFIIDKFVMIASLSAIIIVNCVIMANVLNVNNGFEQDCGDRLFVVTEVCGSLFSSINYNFFNFNYHFGYGCLICNKGICEVCQQ
ncbi:unnamed protein product [Paramecium primaurelia]|uniref:Transmembrane protein n=1 Tax=Paramecium primaurelia TaxID=5886 RepID=A0A8S1MLM1_PARPR|nr:unnamed protein product [Paramecium primaurelia]